MTSAWDKTKKEAKKIEKDVEEVIEDVKEKVHPAKPAAAKAAVAEDTGVAGHAFSFEIPVHDASIETQLVNDVQQAVNRVVDVYNLGVANFKHEAIDRFEAWLDAEQEKK
jgi:2-oxoglutarate dehydrogenase complex dehydrogenase (E1) component-like enzyme